MSPETIFSICNTAVLPGWLLLAVLPRWKWTTRLITSVIIPALLGFVYLYLVLAHFNEAEGGFGSLAQVQQLFQNPFALLGGWIHYLAFDLFIGSWEVRDAQRLGLNHFLVIPCLALTFLFGPIGLMLYFLIRFAVKKQTLVEN
jgi:hypothetical protein